MSRNARTTPATTEPIRKVGSSPRHISATIASISSVNTSESVIGCFLPWLIRCKAQPGRQMIGGLGHRADRTPDIGGQGSPAPQARELAASSDRLLEHPADKFLLARPLDPGQTQLARNGHQGLAIELQPGQQRGTVLLGLTRPQALSHRRRRHPPAHRPARIDARPRLDFADLSPPRPRSTSVSTPRATRPQMPAGRIRSGSRVPTVSTAARIRPRKRKNLDTLIGCVPFSGGDSVTAHGGHIPPHDAAQRRLAPRRTPRPTGHAPQPDARTTRTTPKRPHRAPGGTTPDTSTPTRPPSRSLLTSRRASGVRIVRPPHGSKSHDPPPRTPQLDPVGRR